MVKKIKHYKKFNILKKHKGSILLIGNFDGIHLGHQKLFYKAKQLKNKNKKIKIGLITFDPMPKMFFNKDIKNFKISNFNQKISYLKNFSVDFVINKKFDKKFSKIKSKDFIDKILFKKLKPKFIFVSSNFRFGNKREGNVRLLKDYQKKYKYKLINPTPLIRNKKVISSTLIRKLLFQGKLEYANNLLNRKWSVEGVVKRGRRIGKKVGFPTCNLELGDYIIPKKGVYAVRAKIEDGKKSIKGIANLGFRPTFNQKKILLEVNLFNFSKNIYNKKLTVEFIKFIRKEKKFKGINQLRKQIKKDLIIAKKT
tara:strand:- start:499 stop:1431 length:933 start_codon:yes stop_codon:yes gene_type:complete